MQLETIITQPKETFGNQINTNTTQSPLFGPRSTGLFGLSSGYQQNTVGNFNYNIHNRIKESLFCFVRQATIMDILSKNYYNHQK